jgi:hypothetical protein
VDPKGVPFLPKMGRVLLALMVITALARSLSEGGVPRVGGQHKRCLAV